MAQGRFFSSVEMENKASVCVLSAETAAKLFPLDMPMGKTVRLGSRYYRVSA